MDNFKKIMYEIICIFLLLAVYLYLDTRNSYKSCQGQTTIVNGAEVCLITQTSTQPEVIKTYQVDGAIHRVYEVTIKGETIRYVVTD